MKLNVSVSVQKAPKAPNMPGASMEVDYTKTTVGAVTLPAGWKFDDADIDKKLDVDVPVTVTAKYAGEDADNYEVERHVRIQQLSGSSIKKQPCMLREADIRNVRSAIQFLLPRRLRSSKHKHRMLPSVTQPMYRHTVGRVMRTMQTSGLQMARWQELPVRQSDWKVLR